MATTKKADVGKVKAALTDTGSREVRYMRTGTTLVDLVLAGKKGELGLIQGTIFSLIGDPNAGKTAFINDMLAYCIHTYGKKFKWFKDTVENGDTYDSEETMETYGVDLSAAPKVGNYTFRRSHTVEDMDAQVGLFLNSLQPDELAVYSVDSVDGLSSAAKEAEAKARQDKLKKGEAVVDKGTYGAEIPKFLSQSFFKTKAGPCEQKNLTMILVNQKHPNLDIMSKKDFKVSGGVTQEYYWSNQLHIKAVKQITKNGVPVGFLVEAKSLKSRNKRPGRKCYYTFYPEYGIDNIGSNIDYLYDLINFDNPNLAKYSFIDKPLVWSDRADAPEVTLDGVKAWLEGKGWLEQCRDYARAKNGKANLSVSLMLEFASTVPEIREAMEAEFGRIYTKDELIRAIENDRDMEAELERRVIAKWERIEDEANPVAGRRRKFA